MSACRLARVDLSLPLGAAVLGVHVTPSWSEVEPGNLRMVEDGSAKKVLYLKQKEKKSTDFNFKSDHDRI